jgi:hypothetical protein
MVLYIQKEQIAGTQNDNVMRKSPGRIAWFRALGLIFCKEDHPNRYKIGTALESEKGV